MTTWLPLLSTALGAFFALAGVFITQWWSRRRDEEARIWDRRADAYIALMRWRLDPPDNIAIADPRELAEARQEWIENAYPLLTELSLFGGQDLQGILRRTPYMWQAAPVLADMSPVEILMLVQHDIVRPRRARRVPVPVAKDGD